MNDGKFKPGLRILVVCPSWLGDMVMATPSLRRLREGLPGSFIGALVKPGMEELLTGLNLVDEVHVAHWGGVMGPKVAAGKIRPRRYDTAVLLTNSFGTALAIRMAGISRRIGYDRDMRGLLLTDKLKAPVKADGSWAIVPAVEYYHRLVSACLGAADLTAGEIAARPMELATTTENEQAAGAILSRAGVASGSPMVMLNPGGNNTAKRWPAERYAELAAWLRAMCPASTSPERERVGASDASGAPDPLADARGSLIGGSFTILLNGAPGEAELVREIALSIPGGDVGVVRLPVLGVTIGSLKALVRRCRLVVTNDTGPRHIAAAFGVPVVTLFGPTDHRWTTIPTRANAPERIILADPTLPETESANDHAERCRIDRIELETVRQACTELLSSSP